MVNHVYDGLRKHEPLGLKHIFINKNPSNILEMMRCARGCRVPSIVCQGGVNSPRGIMLVADC